MSRPVQVCFDATAERWEIGYADALGTTVPLPADDVVRVGRSVDGRVVEVVVDSVVVPTDGVALIGASFGPAVAEVIRSAVPGRDLDMTVTVTVPARRADTTPAIVGEPGVPLRRNDDVYAAPLERGEVEIRVTRGELRLLLPGDFGTSQWWVRVSEVETGELLALGPVRRQPDGVGANVAFGLDLTPDQLHVAVTEHPLAEVGTRLQRRIQWVDRLLLEAGAVRRLRPRTAARLARRARDIATLIDDADRRLAATRVLSRTRRWGFGSMGVVSVLAVGATGLLLADRGTVPAPDLRPGAVGPVTFQLQDRSTLEATLVGRLPQVSPGEVVPVTLQVTSVQPWAFGPRAGDEVTDVEAALADARRNCLNVTDLPGDTVSAGIVSLPLTVRLDRLDPSNESRSLDRLIVGSFDSATQVLSYTSDKDSCRSAQFGLDNGFQADTFVRRAPQTIEIPLPDDLPAGLWELSIEGSTPVVDQVGTLRLRVTP